MEKGGKGMMEERMRAKIVAVDLDGTLCEGVCWTVEEVAAARVNEALR